MCSLTRQDLRPGRLRVSFNLLARPMLWRIYASDQAKKIHIAIWGVPWLSKVDFNGLWPIFSCLDNCWAWWLPSVSQADLIILLGVILLSALVSCPKLTGVLSQLLKVWPIWIHDWVAMFLAQVLRSQGMGLRSLAPFQISITEFSGQTQAVTKAFPDRSHQVNCLLTPGLVHGQCLIVCKVVTVKDSGPPGCPALQHVCIPTHVFPFRDLLTDRGQKNLKDHFLHSDSVLTAFPNLRLPSSPYPSNHPSPYNWKNAQVSCLGLPSQDCWFIWPWPFHENWVLISDIYVGKEMD